MLRGGRRALGPALLAACVVANARTPAARSLLRCVRAPTEADCLQPQGVPGGLPPGPLGRRQSAGAERRGDAGAQQRGARRQPGARHQRKKKEEEDEEKHSRRRKNAAALCKARSKGRLSCRSRLPFLPIHSSSQELFACNELSHCEAAARSALSAGGTVRRLPLDPSADVRMALHRLVADPEAADLLVVGAGRRGYLQARRSCMRMLSASSRVLPS